MGRPRVPRQLQVGSTVFKIGDTGGRRRRGFDGIEPPLEDSPDPQRHPARSAFQEGVTPAGCTIEAGAKDATAPYKFFELSDVGLSVIDSDEGLLVTAVKAGTPFGDCGLAKGDVIRAIDDAPAGRAAEFRKLVRREHWCAGGRLVWLPSSAATKSPTSPSSFRSPSNLLGRPSRSGLQCGPPWNNGPL